MKRHGRPATVGMPKLSMRTALSNLNKPQLPEKRHDFARLQDWHLAHKSRHFDGLRPDKHALETGIAFLEKHLDDFLQIGSKFVQRFALAVRTWKTRYPPNVHAGVGISLDDGCEVLHPVASLTSDDTRSSVHVG